MDPVTKILIDAVYDALDQLQNHLNEQQPPIVVPPADPPTELSPEEKFVARLAQSGITWDGSDKPRMFEEIKALGFAPAFALFQDVLIIFGQTAELEAVRSEMSGKGEESLWPILEQAVNS